MNGIGDITGFRARRTWVLDHGFQLPGCDNYQGAVTIGSLDDSLFSQLSLPQLPGLILLMPTTASRHHASPHLGSAVTRQIYQFAIDTVDLVEARAFLTELF